MKLTTNILDIKIDYEKVDRDFVIVEFKTDSEKKPDPRIFDIEDVNMYSLSYTSGKYAYALMDENGYNDLLYATLDESISYKKVNAEYADKYKTLTRLFINALSNYSNDLAYNNLTGKFYRLDFKKKNPLKMEELSVEYDDKNDIAMLKCSACTFIRVNRFDDKEPIYTFGGNYNTMKRCFKPCDNMYKKKGLLNKRASKVFLELKDGSGRAKTMYTLIDDLNKTFSKYLNIKFKEYEIIESMPSKGKKLQDITKELIANYKIVIVNLTKEAENIEYIEKFKENLEKALDKKIKIIQDLQKGAFNIVIIHNKDYYDERKIIDIHNKLPKDIITQCITIEEIPSVINKFPEETTPALVTVLKELLIKNDIINTNVFTYDDWSKYNFTNDWEFIKCDKDKKALYKMIISNDGHYKIEKIEMTLLNFEEYDENIRIFKDNYNMELIIKDDVGNINYIERTNIITMPKSIVFDSLPIRKDKQTRNNCYPGLLNINYTEIDNVNYYNVGMNYKNLKFEFTRASHLRRIIRINNSKNLVKELLSLMSVSFVKYNELTILPYPVKYLNEYIELNT